MPAGTPDYWLRGARIQLVDEIKLVDEVKLIDTIDVINTLKTVESVNSIGNVNTVGTVTTLKTVETVNLISKVDLIDVINSITYIKKVEALGPNPDVYGDGSDGDKVVDADWTLDRDYNFRNLTIKAGVTLTTNNYRIRCTGKFVNNGIVTAKGLGGAGAPSRSFSGYYCGNGENGSEKIASNIRLGGGGGEGGYDVNGGSGKTAAGGNGGGLIWIAAPELYNNGILDARGEDASPPSADTADSAFGGGGGGGGGLIMLIYKYSIFNYKAFAAGGVGSAGAKNGHVFADQKGGDGADGYATGGVGAVAAAGGAGSSGDTGGGGAGGGVSTSSPYIFNGGDGGDGSIITKKED